MAFAGTIAIGLVANVTELKGGFAKAAGIVSGFAGKMANSLGNMAARLDAKGFGRTATIVNSLGMGMSFLARNATLALGVLSAVATGATLVARSVIKATKSLADMDDLAKGLGTTQARIAGLQVAAGRVGLDPESTTNAIMQMTKNLTKAKYEGGDAAKMVAALGLDLDKLTKVDASAAFVAIANQIRQLPDHFSQAKAAEELFGRSGIQMMNLLKLGVEDYSGAMADAVAFGKAFSEEQILAAQRADDAWENAKNAMSGTWGQMLNRLAPLLTWAAEGVEGIFTTFVGGADEAKKSLEELEKTVRGMGAKKPSFDAATFGAAGKKAQEFKAETLSRLAVGLPSVAAKQEVKDVVSHQLLTRIATRVERPAYAIAGRG